MGELLCQPEMVPVLKPPPLFSHYWRLKDSGYLSSATSRSEYETWACLPTSLQDADYYKGKVDDKAEGDNP